MFKVFNERVDTEEMRRALIRMGYPMQTDINQHMELDDREIADFLPVATRLGKAPIGLGHDKFLRQIPVSFDVLAPRYWWAQFDTYGIFTVKNSQSTMHRIKKINYDACAEEYVDARILSIFKEIVNDYIQNPTAENLLRAKANLPEGICLVAGITTNYAQLKTIYHQRWNHRLPHWKQFCRWIEELPLAKEFGVADKKENQA